MIDQLKTKIDTKIKLNIKKNVALFKMGTSRMEKKEVQKFSRQSTTGFDLPKELSMKDTQKHISDKKLSNRMMTFKEQKQNHNHNDNCVHAIDEE